MSLNHHLPKKIDLKPKKHHGFQFLLFLFGILLPPLAVATRFGIGKDFFINCFLCICGYIPSHGHNFYIQNIRNNTNRARTPKWALKAGLVDTSDRDRRARKNQWSKRFDERNAHSTHVGQALEEGETGENYIPVSEQEQEAERRRNHEGLWNDQEDAEYYNEDAAPNQQRWHYPANFEGTVADGSGRKAKKGKGDRWERSRASRTDSTSSASSYPPAAAADDDVPEWGRDYGAKRRSSKKGKKGNTNNNGSNGWAANGNGGLIDDLDGGDGYRGGRQNQRYDSGGSNGRYDQGGEGRYGSSGGGGGGGGAAGAGGRQVQKAKNPDDVFNHEF